MTMKRLGGCNKSPVKTMLWSILTSLTTQTSHMTEGALLTPCHCSYCISVHSDRLQEQTLNLDSATGGAALTKAAHIHTRPQLLRKGERKKSDSIIKATIYAQSKVYMT